MVEKQWVKNGRKFFRNSLKIAKVFKNEESVKLEMQNSLKKNYHVTDTRKQTYLFLFTVTDV
jgi:hypothetical protein